MDRQSRLRVPGLIFLLVLAFQFLATREGTEFGSSLLSGRFEDSALQLIVGTALAIFASDSVGYILSSLHVRLFNRRRGYSGQYERNIAYSHFPEVLRSEYEHTRTPVNSEPVHFTFEQRWPRFTPEQLLVYFFWHRPEAPNPLEPWVERRNTAYFTALSTCTGLVLATAIAGAWIGLAPLHWSLWNGVILLLSASLFLVLYLNGQAAMRDGLAAIDLVIAGHLNPAVRGLFREHDPRTVSRPPPKAA
jgi:hypothetical protein